MSGLSSPACPMARTGHQCHYRHHRLRGKAAWTMTKPSVERQQERSAPDVGLKLPGFLADAPWPLLPVVGVAAIVMGVLLLVWPGPSLVVVGALFGIYLVVTGVFQLMEAFAPHMPGYLRAMGLISGAFSLLLGLICFRGPAESILLL